MRKKGFKVKRTRRNLYKKRKSPARKVAETVLLVVIAGALVFVGYSIAPPLINYFSQLAENENSSSEPVWTPPQTDNSSSDNSADTSGNDNSGNNSGDNSNSSSNSGDNSGDKPQPETKGLGSTVTAPASAIKSEAALKKYLEGAKSSGADTVIFSLKNTEGALLYKSTVAAVKDNKDINTGALTAAQIAKACKAAGVTAATEINTLYDRLSCYLFEDGCYNTTDKYTWLDAAPGDGGKPWATPYSANVVNYIADIANELTKAGFDAVILSNTMFPNFGNYDYSILPSNLQAANRSDKLAELAAACAKKISAQNADCYVKIDAADFLTKGIAAYKSTAEIYSSRAKLGGAKLLISLDTADLGKKLQVTEKSEITVNKDISKAISQVFASVDKTLKADKVTEYAVGITGSSALSDAQKKAAQTALDKLNAADVIIN